jgi:hypothetical protein
VEFWFENIPSGNPGAKSSFCSLNLRGKKVIVAILMIGAIQGFDRIVIRQARRQGCQILFAAMYQKGKNRLNDHKITKWT